MSSAPKIMTTIVEHIIATDPVTQTAMSSYIDDLHVNENVLSVDNVREHFKQWDLETKEPEKLGKQEAVRVLGLKRILT